MSLFDFILYVSASCMCSFKDAVSSRTTYKDSLNSGNIAVSSSDEEARPFNCTNFSSTPFRAACSSDTVFCDTLTSSTTTYFSWWAPTKTSQAPGYQLEPSSAIQESHIAAVPIPFATPAWRHGQLKSNRHLFQNKTPGVPTPTDQRKPLHPSSTPILSSSDLQLYILGSCISRKHRNSLHGT